MQRAEFYPIFVSSIAALGGLLFGYNTSIISGALLFISSEFSLGTLQKELIVSTLLIGALLGALIGGFLADAFGRKKTLYLTLFIFFIGSLFLWRADGFSFLLIGRLITGFGVGVVSMAAPLYIAEMSPPAKRGALVSLNQLCITLGILIAYIVAFFAEGNWRWMFAFAFCPIAIQFLGLFFVPETPIWLKGEKPAKTSWRALLNPTIRLPFLIGIGVAVFQSITGINTVIYYAPTIFQLAGFQATQTALFATVLVGIVNAVVTVLALWLIDRVGRRALLILGLIGMALALCMLGLSFFASSELAGFIAFVSLLGYVAFFAVSLGPVAWLIISEVYPEEIRGRAMGIATFSNWLCNYFVSLTFLTLIQQLGISATFWLYALICFLGLWFVIRLVPETKGKTFEQIQHFWQKR